LSDSKGAESAIPAVVLPVQHQYIEALVAHPDDLTTLIFGWQGKNQKRAKRLVGPERKWRANGYIAFLFRASHHDADRDAPRMITHAAVAGFMLHRRDPEYPKYKSFLYTSRVERYTGARRSDEVEPNEIGTFYVVAGVQKLDDPIPFERLTLLSEGRPLNPAMARGYATVALPDDLVTWYRESTSHWDRIAKAAGFQA
jgi:hypothetical protein